MIVGTGAGHAVALVGVTSPFGTLVAVLTDQVRAVAPVPNDGVKLMLHSVPATLAGRFATIVPLVPIWMLVTSVVAVGPLVEMPKEVQASAAVEDKVIAPPFS